MRWPITNWRNLGIGTTHSTCLHVYFAIANDLFSDWTELWKIRRLHSLLYLHRSLLLPLVWTCQSHQASSRCFWRSTLAPQLSKTTDCTCQVGKRSQWLTGPVEKGVNEVIIDEVKVKNASILCESPPNPLWASESALWCQHFPWQEKSGISPQPSFQRFETVLQRII